MDFYEEFKKYSKNQTENIEEKSELLSLFLFFENYFKVFKEIEENSKIGLVYEKTKLNSKHINTEHLNYKIYVDKKSYVQSLKRWYYCQKRMEIYDRFELIFSEYIKYINIVKSKSIDYFLLKQKIELLNILIKEKLEILMKTYQDTPEVVEKIQNLIDLII